MNSDVCPNPLSKSVKKIINTKKCSLVDTDAFSHF
jgi:hypothetical protein